MSTDLQPLAAHMQDPGFIASVVVLVVGLIVLFAGTKVLPPLAVVAGAGVGWVVGSSLQAIVAPSWPWLACAIGGAVTGALLAMLGLRLLVASFGGLLGAVAGLAIAAFAIDRGVVPPPAMVVVVSQSASTGPSQSRAANGTPSARIATLLNEAMGHGAIIGASFRIGDAWCPEADGAIHPLPLSTASTEIDHWWSTLQPPERTVVTGSVGVGLAVGFLGGLLFFKSALALIAALSGGYLVTSAGWALLSRLVPAARDESDAAWWGTLVVVSIIGFSVQVRKAGSPAPAQGDDASAG